MIMKINKKTNPRLAFLRYSNPMHLGFFAPVFLLLIGNSFLPVFSRKFSRRINIREIRDVII